MNRQTLPIKAIHFTMDWQPFTEKVASNEDKTCRSMSIKSRKHSDQSYVSWGGGSHNHRNTNWYSNDQKVPLPPSNLETREGYQF